MILLSLIFGGAGGIFINWMVPEWRSPAEAAFLTFWGVTTAAALPAFATLILPKFPAWLTAFLIIVGVAGATHQVFILKGRPLIDMRDDYRAPKVIGRPLIARVR